jgi:signal transduction histidine kinase
VSHAVFAALLGICAVVIGLDPGAAAWSRLAAFGVLLALGLVYAVFAVPAFRDSKVGFRDGLYVAAAVVLVTAGFAVRPEVALLLFAIYPQVWALQSWRAAAIWTLLLSCAIGLVALVVHDQPPVAVVLQVGISLAVSMLLGTWIDRIITESRQRAAVIEELERTRAELAAVSHDAGVLAERERLAREIHDTLAQGFTSVLMLLEVAESDMDTDPAAARRRLDVAARTVRQNLAEARSLVAALTPVDLQAAPLPEAVGRLVDRFRGEAALSARLAVEGTPRLLPPAADVVLLRTAQEALANVRKHAGPCRVAVRLRYAADGVEIEVADDGAGFVQDGTPSRGYGLAGMRRRVEEAGGVLQVDSRPGAGTTVRVRIA